MPGTCRLLAAVPPLVAQFPVGNEALFLGTQIEGKKGPYPVAYLVSRPQLRRDEDVDALAGDAGVPRRRPYLWPPRRHRRPVAVPR